MLEQLPELPDDPILGLAAECRSDSNPKKVDLTVGIYMDESGRCPIFKSIARAQEKLIDEELTKAYIPAVGDEAFNIGMRELIFGSDSSALNDGRISSIQTPGGCGALRIGAEIIHSAAPGAKVWVSDPTWPVHIPLLGSVGLNFETYRYYDSEIKGLNFSMMLDDLSNACKGDVVLLHGCCHNPCGADLTMDQWKQLTELSQRQGFTPMIDLAYQGLGAGLEDDAAGLRYLADNVAEVIVAASCSKNMGLYRERTGIILFQSKSSSSARAIASQAKVAARKVYSMPPAHGGILAGLVLTDSKLREDWIAELNAMCMRINSLRDQLATLLTGACGRDFDFIRRENGMFSFLGLTPEQAKSLRSEHSVYMLDSSRINVAGINANNIDYLVKSIASVTS